VRTNWVRVVYASCASAQLLACSAEQSLPGIAAGAPGGAPSSAAAPLDDAGPAASSAAPATGDPVAMPAVEGRGPTALLTPDGDAGLGRVDGGSPDAGGALVAGSLAVSWNHGAADCALSEDPELQAHAYNATTYIFRQDKCRTFEAPFVYLLLGRDSALLLDTGATGSATLRDTVTPLVGARALIVAHTHAHGDHVASDARFAGQPSTTVIGTGLGQVQAAFGIEPWPAASAELDLGERVLDVLAIPGHEQTHLALYDRQTGLLLTGDTLYPGLLFINDWATYRTSIRRLAEFVRTHELSHVLGAHIEMSSTAGASYPYGTSYQPEEHVLQLGAAHVLELDGALTELGAVPPSAPVVHADFVLVPQ
jgi:hydroxyacylglutathione hydrolase